MVPPGWDIGPTFDGPLPQAQLDAPYLGHSTKGNLYTSYIGCRISADSELAIGQCGLLRSHSLIEFKETNAYRQLKCYELSKHEENTYETKIYMITTT